MPFAVFSFSYVHQTFKVRFQSSVPIVAFEFHAYHHRSSGNFAFGMIVNEARFSFLQLFGKLVRLGNSMEDLRDFHI